MDVVGVLRQLRHVRQGAAQRQRGEREDKHAPRPGEEGPSSGIPPFSLAQL